MVVSLAPRPTNEEFRAKAVVKTGLIDAPKPEIFQVYCDLAKEITGFKSATFSLYDGDIQCAISATGKDDFEVGAKSDRDQYNICSYVLLDVEPLIMEDIWADPDWKNHPKAKDGTGSRGYAGFPVINRDNYALGTLCMTNPEPRALSKEKILLIKKITENMAHLIDIQADQQEITSQKMLEAVSVFKKEDESFSLEDFKIFLALNSDIRTDISNSKRLIKNNICEEGQDKNLIITPKGAQLRAKMKLEARPMKRIKLSGGEADILIDQMFANLN